jgi:putative addiction module antidote
MYELKIRKIGNSLGVVLPKEVLGKMKVGKDDEIYLTDSPDGFRLTPFNEEFEVQMKEAEKIMNEDRDLLRELSKR